MSIFAVPNGRFFRAEYTGEMPEWSNRAALEMRCTGNCTGGSNPCLSAINAENQQIVKQAPNFTPKSVKLGAFVLYLRFILENRDTTNVIG